MMPLLSRAPRAVAAVCALALLAGCTTSQNLISGKREAGAYSWAQERQIGAEADQQVAAQFGLYEDEQLTAYVRRIGEDVLAESPFRAPGTPAEFKNTPFTFRVLDSDVPNAMALPGGYIYVTRGLLAGLENEAQLAVVLGHEIGHVAGRHASARAAKQQLGQLGIVGAAVLGQAVLGGSAAEQVLNIGGAGVQLLFLKYGRDQERESDQVGVEYAELAGYEASEAAAFFRSLDRLSAQSGEEIPGFLSTHPDPGEREQTIVQLAQQYPQGTAVNAEAYLNAIDGIVLGEDPRQGYTEGGMFYHPGLRFQFAVPQGFRVINSPAQVSIVDPDGQSGYAFTFAQGTPQQAAQQFAQQEGLRLVNQSAKRVNGKDAYVQIFEAQTQQGALGAIVYHIAHGGNTYRFYAIAPAGVFNDQRSRFAQTIESFRDLTDPSKLNRQPTRLDVERVSRTAPFRQLAQGRPLPPGMTLETLAILNQVELDETIQAGARLKLPR